MPLRVHHLQQSNTERVVWLCEELGIPYDLKVYPRDQATTLAPPGLKVLYFAQSAPVIEDTTDSGTTTLAECSAIVEYIIHRHGNGRLLLPATHPDYPSFIHWLHAVAGTILRVAETGKSIAGEEFTAADIMAVFPITTMRSFHQFDLGEFPALLAC